MKKAVLLCLLVCLMGVVSAEAETAEAMTFFWPDITGKVLFSMTEPELKALKEFDEKSYISASHYDEYAYEITAMEFDDASQSHETARYMARISYKTGQIRHIRLESLETAEVSGTVYELDYPFVSAWLRTRYGEPTHSRETGTCAPYALDEVKTESYTETRYGWRSSTTYTYELIDYEQWILPTLDGSEMLVYHVSFAMRNNGAEPVTTHKVMFYPYSWKLKLIEDESASSMQSEAKAN